jgi:hypothetical protein
VPDAPRCPDGQACARASVDGPFVCTDEDNIGAGGAGGAGGTGGGESKPPPDAPAARCFGTGLGGPLCLAGPPSGALTIASPAIIDTNSVGPSGCTEIVARPPGPPICVIARATIAVAAPLRVRGGLPLALVASRTLAVDAPLDAAGRGDAPGPGARTCEAGAGRAAPSPLSGGAGGAGGSFGTAGAGGGQGALTTEGGAARPAEPGDVLTGGCAGGRGGDGFGGGGGGAGGAGGGALWLIAGESLRVSAEIHASGGGGGRGNTGVDSGGGGAGGLVALDAPAITVTGLILANGGGGGGGHGDTRDAPGAPGADPTSPNVAAPGGAGGPDCGGRGGTGAARAQAAARGGSVPAAGQYCGGGGGGGGAGDVRVFQVPPATVGGAISPAPR